MVEIVNIVNFRKKLNVKAVVIGHFGFGFDYSDGQTIKTRNIYDALVKIYNKDIIKCIDTHGSVKSLIKAPFIILKSFLISNNIIILPAHRGLCVYAPIISIYKIFFPKVRIHYAVVGGWLPSLMKNKLILSKSLKSFDYIYVETNTMKKTLNLMGYECIVMPNFKNLNINSELINSYDKTDTYRLCTFSRVMKEKGIEDAINSVKEINKNEKKICYSLDIYGPIDPNQTEWFKELMVNQPKYIKYKGVVKQEKISKTLSNYFALLFPTRFYTEGIPGTIIDSYASGVPVIASKWESYNDIIDVGITGLAYDFDDLIMLKKILTDIYRQPELIKNMKKNCITYAHKYDANQAINIMKERLE